MSGDRYIIQDQYACYFITMTVVYWIDIFSRREYRDIIVDSLNYCVDHKGLELSAWVLMTNHLHIVGRVVKNSDLAGVSGMSGFLRDFKKFTSKEIIKTSVLVTNEDDKEPGITRSGKMIIMPSI